MRISRKKRPEKPLIPYYRKNHEITAPAVLVLDEDGKSLGTMTIGEALKITEERELDLVEINPKADPPVVKLINFSDFKYQKEKEARRQKAHSRVSEIKGIRLSIRISDHDLEVKKDQAEKFLDRGDKVKIELILRGREGARPELAFDTIRRFMEIVNRTTPVRNEQEIARQGNKVTAIIAKK